MACYCWEIIIIGHVVYSRWIWSKEFHNKTKHFKENNNKSLIIIFIFKYITTTAVKQINSDVNIVNLQHFGKYIQLHSLIILFWLDQGQAQCQLFNIFKMKNKEPKCTYNAVEWKTLSPGEILLAELPLLLMYFFPIDMFEKFLDIPVDTCRHRRQNVCRHGSSRGSL